MLLVFAMVPTGAADASELNVRFCGDGAGQSPITSAPSIRPIYAYAADQPNRLTSLGDELQQSLRESDQAVRQASGGRKGLRFDRNPACGNTSADIQAVRMPRSLSGYYAITSPTERFRAVVNDLETSGVKRSGSDDNFLVFLDRGADGAVAGGMAHRSPDDRPGPENASNTGGKVAVVYGAPPSDGPDFFPEDGWPHKGHLPLHEVFHTLGAVNEGAPNAFGAHCLDGYELMCSGRGDPPRCGLERGWDMRVDCGGDDYFNPSPAPGSWLASHWNIYNSWFLCESATCASPESAPQVSLSVSGSGATRTLTASANGASRYFWDLDGQSGFETDTAADNTTRVELPAGRRTYRVRATAPGGAYSVAGVELGQRAAGDDDVSVSCSPTLVKVGGTVTCSAIGSRFEQASSLKWDWGDGTTTSGTNSSHAFTKPGMQSISLTVTSQSLTTYHYITVQVRAGELKLKAAKASRKALKAGKALKLYVSGAGASENLKANFAFRKALQSISAVAGANGKSTLSFKPNKKMKRAFRKAGTLKVTVSSANDGRGSLAIRLR